MKLLFVMLLLGSSISFAAEVGENMKAECIQIISAERSVDVDVESQVGSEENAQPAAVSQ